MSYDNPEFQAKVSKVVDTVIRDLQDSKDNPHCDLIFKGIISRLTRALNGNWR